MCRSLKNTNIEFHEFSCIVVIPENVRSMENDDEKTFEQRIPNRVRCDVILYKTKTRTRENKVVIDKTIHVFI